MARKGATCRWWRCMVWMPNPSCAAIGTLHCVPWEGVDVLLVLAAAVCREAMKGVGAGETGADGRGSQLDDDYKDYY